MNQAIFRADGKNILFLIPVDPDSKSNLELLKKIKNQLQESSKNPFKLFNCGKRMVEGKPYIIIHAEFKYKVDSKVCRILKSELLEVV